MNRLNQILVTAGVAALLSFNVGNLTAQERQDRGNFDPEQFRARMMERYREQLEVKSDDEWKIIGTRVEKVTQARQEVGFGGGRGGFGGPGGRRGGGGDNGGGERRRFGPEPTAEQEALQKALDAKATNDEIKAKLAKYREVRKTKEAALTKAQEELRAVLSVRQEAAAVMMGLLQ